MKASRASRNLLGDQPLFNQSGAHRHLLASRQTSGGLPLAGGHIEPAVPARLVPREMARPVERMPQKQSGLEAEAFGKGRVKLDEAALPDTLQQILLSDLDRARPGCGHASRLLHLQALLAEGATHVVGSSGKGS